MAPHAAIGAAGREAALGGPGGVPGAAAPHSRAGFRGAPVARVRSGIIDRQTVAMPLASRTRATSPTDRQQNGQAGTRAAACTPSACMRSAIAGAVAPTRTSGRRM